MDENSEYLEKISMEVLLHPLLRWTLIALIIVLGGIAVIAASGGQFRAAGQIAAITSAFATILLVSLTAQYAEQTRQLVKESKADRKRRVEERQEDRDQELRSLRRALRKEIASIPDPYFLEGSPYQEVAKQGQFAPMTIFKQNADKIGRLSDDELTMILEYYDRLNKIRIVKEPHREGSDEDIPHSVKEKIRELIHFQESAVEEINEELKEDQ